MLLANGVQNVRVRQRRFVVIRRQASDGEHVKENLNNRTFAVKRNNFYGALTIRMFPRDRRKTKYQLFESWYRVLSLSLSLSLPRRKRYRRQKNAPTMVKAIHGNTMF